MTKSQEVPAVLDPVERALNEVFGDPANVPDGLELRSDHQVPPESLERAGSSPSLRGGTPKRCYVLKTCRALMQATIEQNKGQNSP